MTPYQALYIEFYCDALDKTVTIKEYFLELLKTLWLEEEGFSGKRPFGNSGWQYEIYDLLTQNGILEDHDKFIIKMIGMM